MKWYEMNYVNHRNWILENLNGLGLSANETVMVLLIDYMNEFRMQITVDELVKKSHLTQDDVNETIALLCAKKYLEIKASSMQVKFILDGLFEADITRNEKVLDTPLFDLFESEFGRPLSQKEMEKIASWIKTSDRTMIQYALREASAYQKLSIPYIDKILSVWKEKGYTLQEIDEGKYSWKE